MLTNLTQLLITYLLTYLTVSLLTITTVILSSFRAFPSAIASSVCAHKGTHFTYHIKGS
jgi:hypothetical protein